MSKKVKALQTLVDEFIAKQRNVGNFDLVAQYTKRVQDIVGAHGKHSLIPIMTVEMQLNKGRVGDAEQTVQQALKLFNDDCVLLHYQAKIAFLKREFKAASKFITSSEEQLLASQKTITDANAHLGTPAYRGLSYLNKALRSQLLFAQGYTDEAQKLAEQLYNELVLNADAKLQQHTEWFDQMAFSLVQEALLLVARVAKDQGRIEDSLRILQKFFDRKLPLDKESTLKILCEISAILVHHFAYDAATPRVDSSAVTQVSQSSRDVAEEASQILLLMEHLSVGTMPHKLAPVFHLLYDDLCILFSSFRHQKALLKALERGVSHLYESHYFWNQFALSLINHKKYHRAYKVLCECESLNPNNVSVQLLKLKVMINFYTSKRKECVDLAQDVVETCTKTNVMLLPRAYHYLGIAYANVVSEYSSLADRQVYQMKAIEILTRARELDKHDPIICYHLALQYAEIREIRKAFRFVKKSLAIDSTNADAWILLILLFSAEKDFKNTAKAIKLAKAEHPNNIKLSLLFRRIEELENEKKADKSYFKLLEEVRQKYFDKPNSLDEISPVAPAVSVLTVGNNDANASASSGTTAPPQGLAVIAASATQPPITIGIPSTSNNYSANNPLPQPSSPSFSDVQQTFDIVIQNKLSKYQKQRVLNKIQDIYLQTADALRRLTRYTEAMAILKAVADLPKKYGQSLSPDMYYVTGYIYEDTKRTEAALAEYESALVRDSNHKFSLMRIGLLQHRQHKQHMLARSYLQSAVRVDPNFHEAWYHLGVVMREMGELEEASDCFMTALKLEKTCPICPFESLLRRKV